MIIPNIIEKKHNGERVYDLYSRLLEDRIIFIGDEITDKNSYLIPYKTIFSEDKSYYNNQRTYKIFYDYIRTGY